MGQSPQFCSFWEIWLVIEWYSGTRNEPGVIPRAVNDVFEYIKEVSYPISFVPLHVPIFPLIRSTIRTRHENSCCASHTLRFTMSQSTTFYPPNRRTWEFMKTNKYGASEYTVLNWIISITVYSAREEYMLAPSKKKCLPMQSRR